MNRIDRRAIETGLPAATRLEDKLIGLCFAVAIVTVVTGLLTAIIWGLFWMYRGLTWTFGVASSYVGTIGWVIAVPLIGMAIFETVSRLRPKGKRAVSTRSGRLRWWLSTGSVAVVMSGNLCLNIAAGRIESHYENRKRQGVDIYKNHDLAKLVGECVRLAMLRHAASLPKGKERSALETMAGTVPQRWSEMTDTGGGKQPDPRVLELADGKLTGFLQSSKAKALHRDQWESLLADWRSETKGDALTDGTLRAAAATIAEDFGITLREALKADFEKGGKAWAAMQLDIAQQLLTRTPMSMANDNTEINAALAEIKAMLADDAQGLPALHRTVLDVRRSQEEHARAVVRNFDELIGALARIEYKIDEIDGKLEVVEGALNIIVEELIESERRERRARIEAQRELDELKRRIALSQVELWALMRPELPPQQVRNGVFQAIVKMAEGMSADQFSQVIDQAGRTTDASQLADISSRRADQLWAGARNATAEAIDASRNAAALTAVAGNFDEAERHLLRVLEHEPLDENARMQLMVVLSRAGRPAAALEQADVLLNTGDSATPAAMAFAMFARGTLLWLDLGRPNEGAVAYEKLFEYAKQYPSDVNVRANLLGALVNSIVLNAANFERSKALLGQIRTLAEDHPDDESHRTVLAMGLANAVWVSDADVTRADGFLDELRALRADRPNDSAVREWLAKGLNNAIAASGANGPRAHKLLGELRALSDDFPDDIIVRERLAKGLFNAFNISPANSELADKLLGDLRALRNQHREDAAVRAQYAMGLNNAVARGGVDPTRVNQFLDKLRALRNEHPDDDVVRGILASGLLHAFNHSPADSELAGRLLGEVRTLCSQYPDDVVVREWLAKLLYNALNRSPANSASVDHYLAELRALRDEYPNDIAVRINLLIGLNNAAIKSELDFARTDRFLDELRTLHRQHLEDGDVRRWLVRSIAPAIHYAALGADVARAIKLAEELAMHRHALLMQPDIMPPLIKSLDAVVALVEISSDTDARVRLAAAREAIVSPP